MALFLVHRPVIEASRRADKIGAVIIDAADGPSALVAAQTAVRTRMGGETIPISADITQNAGRTPWIALALASTAALLVQGDVSPPHVLRGV